MALYILPLLLAAEFFLFTSFRGNGESGLYLALSADGHKWEELNEGKPWLPCEHPGQLMRDPYLTQGPDGTWHLLWTWGWTRKEAGGQLRMGHATSKDLVTWSKQEWIPMFEDRPEARNVWAPEMVWDGARKQWVIFWATTMGPADAPYDHRMYAMTTADFKSFSKPSVWFDPGFNVIDATLFRDGGRWAMVVKDERQKPVMKNLRLSFADSPMGPWSAPSEPIPGDWVEGPSVMKIGDWWYVYFDHYSKPHYYGAIRSRDLKTWEDVSKKMTFPAGHRHGTVVRIDEATAKRLKEMRR